MRRTDQLLRSGIVLTMVALGLASLAGCSDLGEDPLSSGTQPSQQSFAEDIQPILASNCTFCHGAGGGYGGLDLSSYAGVMAGGESGPSVIAGDLENSLIYGRITAENAGLRMPPGGSLTEAESSRIRDWIEQGAMDN